MKRLSKARGVAAAVVFLLATTLSSIPAGASTPTPKPLTGARSVTEGIGNSCAILTSGRVDCWGSGYDGQLGNGTFYTTGNHGSALPVVVSA